MRIFLHEFITSGALSGRLLPPSLLREGLAMRRAVTLDLLALGVEVVSTRDDRVPALDHPRLEQFTVPDPTAESDLFRSLCNDVDRILIIAPEIDGELERRVTVALEVAGRERVWNSAGLIATASDKRETFLRLKEADIPTIETCLGTSDDWRAWDCPVAKPRDGAGSQDVRHLTGLDVAPLSDRWIVQPFVRGRWLSCTVLFGINGWRTVFPPAEQLIAADGSFSYLGGAMPARCDVHRVQTLAVGAIRALVNDPADLIGPAGVDLVEEEQSGELLVCEVNPRFTTSYVAARELSATNLLAGLRDFEARSPVWKAGQVEFHAAGEVRARTCHDSENCGSRSR